MSTEESFSYEDLVKMARDIVVKNQKASISLVQRHLNIRYNLAGRLLESLEVEKVVSPMDESGRRAILVAEGGEV